MSRSNEGFQRGFCDEFVDKNRRFCATNGRLINIKNNIYISHKVDLYSVKDCVFSIVNWVKILDEIFLLENSNMETNLGQNTDRCIICECNNRNEVIKSIYLPTNRQTNQKTFVWFSQNFACAFFKSMIPELLSN